MPLDNIFEYFFSLFLAFAHHPPLFTTPDIYTLSFLSYSPSCSIRGLFPGDDVAHMNEILNIRHQMKSQARFLPMSSQRLHL